MRRHASDADAEASWLTTLRGRRVVAMAALVVVGAAVFGAASESGNAELSTVEAVLLGLVEGLTEYLPVSSTAHLAVVADLLGLTATPAGERAANAYAIVIQIGAIAAVLGIYRQRIRSLACGLFGSDPESRPLALAVFVAFLPAAGAGLLLGDVIKDQFFSTWPIVAAWLLGGIALLWPSLTTTTSSRPLEELTIRAAALIGLVQVLALWPGTSRSLVTIVAALAVGLSLSAAVEFSFLLGLVTLSAATGYQLVSDGSTILETFGWGNSLIGVATAGATAWLAVTWMVSYLQRRPLSVFGWYRIAVAAVVALLATATGAL